MYRMLIVEDEPATIEGIKSAINWSLLDISICGEATNGLEAYQLIEDLKPDIILCDIRMPKMDGITLISEIQPRYPDIKVIFLSGHSDKEYLKKAIRLNVIDYLYKPLELPELIQAVEKAKVACKKHSITENKPDSNMALNLIQGWNPGSNSPDIPLNLEDTLVTLVIRFDMSFERALESNSFTINHYQPKLIKIFTEVFGTRYVISAYEHGYILHANVPKNFLQQDEKVHQLDNLFRIAGKDAQYLTVGIGNTVESYKSLKDSFQQARAAIHSAFLDGYGKLILFKNLSETLFHPAIDLEDQFFNQIHMGNMASSIDFLEEYIIYMSRCRQEDIPAIKDELAGISFRLNQILKKQEKIQESFVTQTINNAMEIMDIKNYLLNLLDQILDEINQLDSKGRIIFDVEKYILTNYDKDLSIKEIAENVFITPNYLCHLYKSKTGITVNSFMLETKMKKSKKLLTETNLKLGEISEKLGYSNHNYFTRTFKKYFGITPSAFRNKRL